MIPHVARKPETAHVDLAVLARRLVVGIAAGAGLVGMLTGRPVLTVVWRAGAVAVIGLVAIATAERLASRARAPRRNDGRGGAR